MNLTCRNTDSPMKSYDKAKAAQLMFDFITSMKSAESADAILNELKLVVDFFGLDCFAVSGIPLPGERIDPYFLLDAWPEGWFERYVQQNYVHVDPVIYHSKMSDDAFVWSEVLGGRALDRRAKQLMNEATEFRMLDGFSVPLHTVGGMQAIVTFGAEKLDLSSEARGILHMVSIYAHNRLRAMMTETRAPGRKPPLQAVTAVERDVIRWCAEGKTNWEIGQILGRSEKTVQHEIHNAQKKLNCVNRTQLIAEAIRFGIIR